MKNIDMEMKVKEIQTWLETQPQLPQYIGKYKDDFADSAVLNQKNI